MIPNRAAPNVSPTLSTDDDKAAVRFGFSLLERVRAKDALSIFGRLLFPEPHSARLWRALGAALITLRAALTSAVALTTVSLVEGSSDSIPEFRSVCAASPRLVESSQVLPCE
jgi:hypothetical protein